MQEAEAVVLAALCRSPEARLKYLGKIVKSDFKYKGHDTMFEILVRMHSSGETITRDKLSAASEDITTRIMFATAFDSNLPALDDEVFGRFKADGARNRITEMRAYIDRHLKKGTAPEEITEAVRSMLDRVGEGNVDDSAISDADSTADSAIRMLEGWADGGAKFRTHIPEIDENLFLAQLTEYVVVGGDPSAGKTAFMISLAKSNARVSGACSAIFSLEMRKEMLCYRMAMDSPRMKGIQLSETSLRSARVLDEIRRAIDETRKLPIIIIDNVTNIFSVARIARSLASRGRITAVMLDYIQLALTDPKDSDVTRVSTVSQTLKNLTTPDPKRGIPSLVTVGLSQYSDSGAKDKSGKPIGPKQMRWSKQIRMDADLLLHLQEAEPPDGMRLLTDQTYLEVFCEKQRNYRNGWRVPLIFDKSTQTFHTPGADSHRKARGARDVPTVPREIEL